MNLVKSGPHWKRPAALSAHAYQHSILDGFIYMILLKKRYNYDHTHTQVSV